MDLARGALIILGAALIVLTGSAFGSEFSKANPAVIQEEPFPNGAGKDVFLSVCSLCHSPAAVTTKQWTEKQWDAKVTEMLQEEPDVTAEERAAIVAYLAANFKPLSKVAVNRASGSELAKGLGLSEKEAEAIVRYRTEKGPFKTFDELKRVPGIDPAKLESLKDRVEF